MSLENSKKSAFGYSNADGDFSSSGLTKREYIATQMMQTLIARSDSLNCDDLAHTAIKCADALLTALTIY